jgi:hypothetical protein
VGCHRLVQVQPKQGKRNQNGVAVASHGGGLLQLRKSAGQRRHGGHVQPNPSFEARPNIKTQAPQGGAGYHPPCGAWVLLLASASIQTLGPTEHQWSYASIRLAQVGSPLSSPLASLNSTSKCDTASEREYNS